MKHTVTYLVRPGSRLANFIHERFAESAKLEWMKPAARRRALQRLTHTPAVPAPRL